MQRIDDHALVRLVGSTQDAGGGCEIPQLRLRHELQIHRQAERTCRLAQFDKGGCQTTLVGIVTGNKNGAGAELAGTFEKRQQRFRIEIRRNANHLDIEDSDAAVAHEAYQGFHARRVIHQRIGKTAGKGRHQAQAEIVVPGISRRAHGLFGCNAEPGQKREGPLTFHAATFAGASISASVTVRSSRPARSTASVAASVDMPSRALISGCASPRITSTKWSSWLT